MLSIYDILPVLARHPCVNGEAPSGLAAPLCSTRTLSPIQALLKGRQGFRAATARRPTARALASLYLLALGSAADVLSYVHPHGTCAFTSMTVTTAYAVLPKAGAC